MKTPIICGREPTAIGEEKKLGVERSTELSTKVNQVSSSLDEIKMKLSLILFLLEEKLIGFLHYP